MEDVLINFKTAKLAEEKGFDFDYIVNNELTIHSLITQSLLQKWLREVHNIVVLIHQYSDTKRYFYLTNEEYNFECDWNKLSYETYEEALEIGLRENLKLIKQYEYVKEKI